MCLLTDVTLFCHFLVYPFKTVTLKTLLLFQQIMQGLYGHAVFWKSLLGQLNSSTLRLGSPEKCLGIQVLSHIKHNVRVSHLQRPVSQKTQGIPLTKISQLVLVRGKVSHSFMRKKINDDACTFLRSVGMRSAGNTALNHGIKTHSASEITEPA